MMGSYNEPQYCNRDHCIDHAVVTKNLFFAGVGSDNVSNYSKSGDNENVHFWMSEKSK